MTAQQSRTLPSASSRDNFFLSYLMGGVRGRLRQLLIVATGLAVGVAALVALTAASTGVRQAQATVLHALYGVGTDISVTAAAPSTGSGARQGMISERDSGKAFVKFPPGLGILDSSVLARLARLPGVAEVAGGLSMSETSVGPAPAGSDLPVLTSVQIQGLDTAHPRLGPYASGTLVSGRSPSAADVGSNVAVVDSRYATAHGLRAGSVLTISNVRFTVIGVVAQSATSNTPEVYVPLDRAQALAALGRHGPAKINTIYVAARGAADIPAVHARITALLPAATVTDSADLAGRVSGSLAQAARLTTELGRWVATALVLAGFALAGLLTTAAVRRRVRELGTLKALGWRTSRIVAQIIAESLVTGVAGAAIGTGLGLAGAALIGANAPTLTATVALNPGSTPPKGAKIDNGTLQTMTLPGGVHTLSVHLHPTVEAWTIALAVSVALCGAVLAGALGSWRVARLRPFHALTRVT